MKIHFLYILFMFAGVGLLYFGWRWVKDFARALGETVGERRAVRIDKKDEELSLTEAASLLTKSGLRRRNVLKLMALGGGAFVLGKVLGPSMSFFPREQSLDKEFFFKNFRVVEKGDTLGFFDRLGNEILNLEKDE